ncbi:restriction endonuclease subunit S [Providencia rettgeri]|nr:restriction endonuclease subunit S [Providencia rettgeri]
MKSPRLNFKYNELYQEQRLGEVTQWFSGGTPSKSNPDYWDGDIDWHTASSLKNTILHFSETKISKLGLENGSRIAEENSILLLVRGSILFKKIPIGMLSRPAAFNQDVKSINCNPQLLPQYLLQWLLAKEHQLLGVVVGTGIGAGKLETDSLKNLKILYPCLELQAKIADFLSSVDEKIALQNRKVELLQQYKKGLIQKLFSQEIRFKDDDGFSFPSWVMTSFGKTYSFLTTNSLPRTCLTDDCGNIKNIHYGDIHTKYPALLDSNIQQIPYIKEGIDTSKFEICKKGDLIIADASEDYNDIGKSIEIVVNNEVSPLVAGLHTFLARPTIDLATGFSGYLMQTEHIRRQIKVLATGISVLGISKSNLAKVTFCIPCKDEQVKIINFLSSIDHKITLENTKLEKLKQWKQGLLQQMFV